MPITLPTQSTLVSIYNVIVTFDPGTGEVGFGGDMPADRRVRIGQGINLFVFDLQTPGEPKAVFPASPLVWLDATSPPFAQGQRFNDHRYTLVVYNTALEAVNNEHLFNVAVVFEGVIHSSNPDPTIINEPPGGG
jgi:hypothetical protein